MKTSVSKNWKITCGHEDTPGTVTYLEPFAGTDIWLSAAQSPLFRTYCGLYEEVKMIGLKVSLAIVSPVGDTTTPSVQIYSAFDRRRGYGAAAPSGASIISASSYNVATALNNNVAKLTRSLYASDLIEKAQWIDSAMDDDNHYRNKAWVAAAANPNFFCPSCAFCFVSPSLAADHQIDISVSVTYYFAFRNPKYGGGGSRAITDDLGGRAVSRLPDGDGDLDADDIFVRAGLTSASEAVQDSMLDDGDMPSDTRAAAAAAKTAARKARLRGTNNPLQREDPGPIRKN